MLYIVCYVYSCMASLGKKTYLHGRHGLLSFHLCAQRLSEALHQPFISRPLHKTLVVQLPIATKTRITYLNSIHNESPDTADPKTPVEYLDALGTIRLFRNLERTKRLALRS
jgi:hypothetical protein